MTRIRMKISTCRGRVNYRRYVEVCLRILAVEATLFLFTQRAFTSPNKRRYAHVNCGRDRFDQARSFHFYRKHLVYHIFALTRCSTEGTLPKYPPSSKYGFIPSFPARSYPCNNTYILTFSCCHACACGHTHTRTDACVDARDRIGRRQSPTTHETVPHQSQGAPREGARASRIHRKTSV